MTDEAALPAGFEDLELFVKRWARDHIQFRWDARAAAQMTEIRDFYDAMLPRAEEVLALIQPLDLNPFAHLLSARLFGPHRVCSMFGNSQYGSLETSQVEKLGQSAMETTNVISAVDNSPVESLLVHPAINSTKTADRSLDINHIFPNTQLDTEQGGFFTHQYWPISVNKTRYESHLYVTRPSNAVDRFRIEQYIGRVAEVILEDTANVVAAQKDLESYGKDFMLLQDNEIMLRHSTYTAERWVGSETVAEAMAG